MTGHTRRQAGENIVRAEEDTQKKSNKGLLGLVKELSAGLSDNVYSSEGKAVIEETRVVLDLYLRWLLNLKKMEQVPSRFQLLSFPSSLKEAVSNVPVDTLKEVPEEELKLQFKSFLERLADLTAELDTDELCESDSKELMKKFFDSAGKLFKNIEMIMQVLAGSSHIAIISRIYIYIYLDMSDMQMSNYDVTR